eukprot:Phypoly_transcript_07979.p1 GENE.Phypoly_transcript_07979~~Phypoly_transcript_07979.p1  ORF type:complete len:385 (+),score=74.01 Phypoly_transcript_07979:177-1331(+)
MGNCCSSIHKKKKRGHRRDDVYDPEDVNQKMIYETSSTYNPKKKEMTTFNTETVKAALEQVQHEQAEDEVEEGSTSSDDDDTSKQLHHSPKTKQQTKGPTAVAKSAPLPKTVERQGSSANIKVFPKFKKPISAIPQHLLREGFQRQKHNSTSSLYINSTMAQPDNDELLRCLATAILYHIEKGVQSPHKTFYDIFNEEKFPITKSKIDARKMPDVDSIYKFLAMIFKAERLDAECGIMCLAYIERMITLTGLTLDPVNWRRIVLSALILASKVWEDQSVWNVDFLPVFDNLTAADLNKLERQFLALLQYNVSLTASLYAKYYFELRTFSKVDSTHFPLQPLDKLNAKRLEDHSQASEYRVRTFKRSASVDQLTPVNAHTPAVLS